MTQALATYEPGDAALVSSRSAEDMSFHLTEVKAQMAVVHDFFQQVMVKGIDYGIIPGTDKAALLKPGAEKLCELYGFAPTVKSVDEEKSIETGFFRARVTVALISKRTGEVVAEGVGEANTHESRYHYRWVYEEKLPPGINKAALVKRSGTSQRGTWTQYRVETDDPHSQWNTILKMGKKRALIDAALSATRSSGLFSQDADAFERYAESDDGQSRNEKRPPVQQPKRRSQASLATEADQVAPPPQQPAAAPAKPIEAPPATSPRDTRPEWMNQLQDQLTAWGKKMNDLAPHVGAPVVPRVLLAWLAKQPKGTDPFAALCALVRADMAVEEAAKTAATSEVEEGDWVPAEALEVDPADVPFE